jgi:hypothetical protein
MMRVSFSQSRLAAISLLFLLIHPPSAWPDVTGLEAFWRDGQTFLTWDLLEGEGFSYRVYRSDSLIASSGDLSLASFIGEVENTCVRNERKTQATDTLWTYCIEDTVFLPETTGLFVHTSREAGSFYYAVTSVQDSSEDSTIIVGTDGNSLGAPVQESVMRPAPVLQIAGLNLQGVTYRDYVHWTSNADTDSLPAMASLPSCPYNFRVLNVSDDTASVVLRFALHSGKEYFTQPARAGDSGMIVISPDCPRLAYPLPFLKKTYWFGYNSNLGLGQPLGEGVNVNYHERRLLYLKEWAVKNLHADPSSVHVTGGSYGACGAVFMGLAHPEEFSSLIAAKPKIDYSDTAFVAFDDLTEVWGHPDDHIPTSDSLDSYHERLNGNWMLENFGHSREYPVMTMFFGKHDSLMGWREKVEFMRIAQEMHIGGAFFWDPSGHGVGVGFWYPEFENRYPTLFRYRTDQSYPAVTFLSIDDDPGNGDPAVGDSIGTIGGYVHWVPETIVDEERFYAVRLGLATFDTTITLPADTATGVVTLRRLQNFKVYQDSLYFYANTDTTTGIVAQSGFMRPDSTGLFTLSGVHLSTNGHRLTFRRVKGLFGCDAIPRE